MIFACYLLLWIEFVISFRRSNIIISSHAKDNQILKLINFLSFKHESQYLPRRFVELQSYVPANSIDYEIDSKELDIMEKEMARELFDNLNNGVGELLAVQTFLEWEDIKETLKKGFIDLETMKFIFFEAGVVGDSMSFDQFMEVVELVNQVSMALEDTAGFEEEDLEDYETIEEYQDLKF
jgi:hypothetical protein